MAPVCRLCITAGVLLFKGEVSALYAGRRGWPGGSSAGFDTGSHIGRRGRRGCILNCLEVGLWADLGGAWLDC